MPIPIVTRDPLPFYAPRVTPDSTRLQQIYANSGAQLSNLALQRGNAQADTLTRLAAIISNGIGDYRTDQTRKQALAQSAAEKDADRKEREAERKQIEADKAAERADRKYEQERGAARYAVANATPGPQSPALYALAQQFPETAARFRVQAPLPATVTPGAAGEVAPAEGNDYPVLDPTDEQMQQQGLRQLQRERYAAEDKARADAASRAAVDDARQAQALGETIRHNKAVEGATAAAANDKTALTDKGVDIAALNYRKTGVMPPLGMGDKGTRQRIINRAAELTAPDIARIESIADIAGNKQDYAANTDSLKSLQKSRDAIGAFEQTAQKNIDVFLDVAGKVVDTGSPLANRLAREVSGSLLGSPDQAAYDAARQVATNEIAKITSNPTLAGQLSDSARHEVDAFNPRNATLAQTVRVMRLLKTEMTNRKEAMDAEIAVVRGRGKSSSTTPPPATGGFIEAIDQQGVVHHAPAGTPLPAGWRLK